MVRSRIRRPHSSHDHVHALLTRLDLRLLLLLWGTDLAYIGIHLIHKFSGSFSKLSSITYDRGYGEYFQYAKEYWLVLLLLLAMIQRFRPVYLAWMLVCLYFVADDCFLMRERLGEWLVVHLDLQPFMRLRARDLGELIVAGGAAIVLVPGIVLTHRRSDEIGRRFSWMLAMLVAVLVGFGVMLDMTHQLVQGNETIDHLAGTIEDGGEMMVMSVMVAFIFRHDPREPPTRPEQRAS